jgi:hypothetical protein
MGGEILFALHVVFQQMGWRGATLSASVKLLYLKFESELPQLQEAREMGSTSRFMVCIMAMPGPPQTLPSQDTVAVSSEESGRLARASEGCSQRRVLLHN